MHVTGYFETFFLTAFCAHTYLIHRHNIMNCYKKIENSNISSRHKTQDSSKRNSNKIIPLKNPTYMQTAITRPINDINLYPSSSRSVDCEITTRTQINLESNANVGKSIWKSAMSPSAKFITTKDKLSSITCKSLSVESIPLNSGPTATKISHFNVKVDNHNAAVKRKRTASISCSQNDSDSNSEPPSAKRKQMLTSPYKSGESSTMTSVYRSPINAFSHEIDTRSSSDFLATDYDVCNAIPDSPNSTHHDNMEEISETTSPSASSIASSHFLYEDLSYHEEATPCQSICSCNTINVRSDQLSDDFTATHYNCMTPAAETEMLRQCPLPALSWANAGDVWQLMCKKDEDATCLRNASMLERHPGLQPRMRAILLDWLIEVCEVYKLHRETYYLALDYLDRYLSVQKNVQKTHLQLIGITCLFIAAKVEEIYPPKIGEFAYVTDGACQESDILQQEVLLLQSLEWNINPVTPMGWLGVFMQLNVNNRTPASIRHNVNKSNPTTPRHKSSSTDKFNSKEAFIYQQFSSMEFVQTAQLLDLCSLDVGIADYSYSVTAAAAMSHTFDKKIALRCSGLDWQAIEACSRWMYPFFRVIREESGYLQLVEQSDQVSTRFGLGHICPNIVTDDSHIIQTHTTTMAMFNRSSLILEQNRIAAKVKQEASPAAGMLCSEGPLTPPASSRKLAETNEFSGDIEIEKNSHKNKDTIITGNT